MTANMDQRMSSLAQDLMVFVQEWADSFESRRDVAAALENHWQQLECVEK
jgi:hypothetical protein